MVRNDRIKVSKIAGFIVDSVEKGVFFTDTVNGELLKVQVQNPGTTGSIHLYESGTQDSFGVYAITSGTNAQSLATAGSEYSYSKIGVVGSALTSGTNNQLGPIMIYYK